MEIKRPITGMIHTLRDKTVQTYQEEMKIEGKTIKQEEGEEAFSLPAAQSSVQPLAHEQHSTKTQSSLNHFNTNDMALPPAPAAMATESSCCMCNCKSTLQAILLELRTMRKLIQTQRGTRNKRSSQIPVTWSRSSISRWRTRKRRSGHRVTKRTTPPTPSSEADVRETLCREDTSSTWAPSTPDPVISKVQLVEDYDVFIPKAQLDSILLNYTRSGSLLFRKLVCAFFDDATLANSLPSGKRKRGLNDHRKGLDQNIVGAIRVFTEKYCAANGIEKLPAPSDWVQILQDQIKLARRRFKRAETVLDSNEIQHRTCRVKTEECEQPLNKVEIMTQNGAYERTGRLVAMDTT